MFLTTSTKLVIGRGELYFDRFLPGTNVGEGELYLGNTPGFSVGREVQALERQTSYRGTVTTIDSVVTREIIQANVVTDNIDIENLALWFGGSIGNESQVAANQQEEHFTVRKGRYYQLGMTYAPYGVRHVEPDIVFKIGSDVLDQATNISLNRTEGRFLIRADAPDIETGDTVTVEFQWRSSLSKTLHSEASEIRGSLRFVATNPRGPRKNYFFPRVSLKPTGQIDLKGDQWQQFAFDVQVQRLNPSSEYIYILESAEATYTDDEQAIIDLGPISLEAFVLVEDELDIIINTNIPDADYGAPL